MNANLSQMPKSIVRIWMSEVSFYLFKVSNARSLIEYDQHEYRTTTHKIHTRLLKVRQSIK